MTTAKLNAAARTMLMGRAEVTVFPSAQTLFAATAAEFFRAIEQTLHSAQPCYVALTGGETARSFYAVISARLAAEPPLQQLAWERVHFFFGDERAVPPDHPDSNYKMAAESLLSNPALASATVHRIRAELPPQQAAQQYEQEMRAAFGDHLPRFHLLLLGMGNDGHTASLFPGTAALDASDRWVTENWVPKLDAFRITLTYPVLNNAAEVLFAASGETKRAALSAIFLRQAQLPAARLQPAGRLLWYVDEAAATDLLTKAS